MRFLAAALACLIAWPCFAQAPGPVGSEAEARREQAWRVPAAGGSPLMMATVMRPPGEERHPLVVIAHSEPVDPAFRPKMPRQRYITLGSWFIDRGYVVVMPSRRGYGPTGGAYAEGYGPCDNPDYAGAGLQTAADIKAAIDYMRTLPFVSPDHTIVIGNDAGGWGALALASLNSPGVSGVINFAGGRGAHQKLPNGGVGICGFNILLQAAAKYGSTARVPSLWIYAANDSFYGPVVSRRLFDAYAKAGGRAVYQQVSALPPEGHYLATSDAGTSIWAPPIDQFLKGLK